MAQDEVKTNGAMKKLIIIFLFLQIPPGFAQPFCALTIDQVLDSLKGGRYKFWEPVNKLSRDPEYYKGFDWVNFVPTNLVQHPDSNSMVVYRFIGKRNFLIDNVPTKFSKLRLLIYPFTGFTVFLVSNFLIGGDNIRGTENCFVYDHASRTYYFFHSGRVNPSSWPVAVANVMELDHHLRVKKRVGVNSGEVWFRSSFRYGRTKREKLEFVSREAGFDDRFLIRDRSLHDLFHQPAPKDSTPRVLRLDLPPFYDRTRTPLWCLDLRQFDHSGKDVKLDLYNRNPRR